MMLSECALVIWLDEIIEVQKGLDRVKKSFENQYPTSTLLSVIFSYPTSAIIYSLFQHLYLPFPHLVTLNLCHVPTLLHCIHASGISAAQHIHHPVISPVITCILIWQFGTPLTASTNRYILHTKSLLSPYITYLPLPFPCSHLSIATIPVIPHIWCHAHPPPSMPLSFSFIPIIPHLWCCCFNHPASFLHHSIVSRHSLPLWYFISDVSLWPPFLSLPHLCCCRPNQTQNLLYKCHCDPHLHCHHFFLDFIVLCILLPSLIIICCNRTVPLSPPSSSFQTSAGHHVSSLPFHLILPYH